MTFDSREKSRYSGAPVECFRFAHGQSVWLFTSADREVVLPAGTFTPAVVQRSELDHSQEDGAGSVEVRIPLDLPLVSAFIGFVPATPVSVTIYRAHRTEESDYKATFVGTVASVVFEGSEAVLTCSPISGTFRRRVPGQTFQSQCNHPLYGPGCGLDRNSFRDVCTVGSVSGSTVTSTDFGARANGYFTNGWLEDPATGEVRWIVDHVGSTVTLMNPFPALAGGQTVNAFAGCDRTEATCAAKFNNLVNHLGFPRVPGRNPHDGSIV